jgi:hypothetical protein
VSVSLSVWERPTFVVRRCGLKAVGIYVRRNPAVACTTLLGGKVMSLYWAFQKNRITGGMRFALLKTNHTPTFGSEFVKGGVIVNIRKRFILPFGGLMSGATAGQKQSAGRE